MNKNKTAIKLLCRPQGATMKEITEAAGRPNYGLLKLLRERGYKVVTLRAGRTGAALYKAAAPLHYTATVTSKGQVTIPQPIRELLKIKTGDTVTFKIRGDEILISRDPG